MTKAKTGVGTFRQRVDVSIEVLVSSPESEFDGPPRLTTDQLQTAIEDYVREEILGSALTRSTTNVSAGRGPTAIDYYEPGREIRPITRRDGTTVEPILTTLADLLPQRVRS